MDIYLQLFFPGELRIKSSALKASNLGADYLNGIPFASIFTLGTNQTFNHGIKVVGSVVVKQPLIVREYVNGLSLEHESENTVMVSGSFELVV